VKREQFIRQLREACAERGWTFEIDFKSGKGSHYRAVANGRKTTIKSGELSPQYMRIVRKQLGLD
jgi:hypothetical protein